MCKFRGTIAAAIATLALSGCGTIVSTHGNMIDDYRLEQVQPGVSTAEDVLAVWGSPTAVATFDPNVWYYIGQRTEEWAFFQPEIVERRVIVIVVDDFGMVADMKTLSLEDGQEIEMVERETPTLGREMGFLEQLLGNVGRFNEDQPVTAGQGRPPI